MLEKPCSVQVAAIALSAQRIRAIPEADAESKSPDGHDLASPEIHALREWRHGMRYLTLTIMVAAMVIGLSGWCAAGTEPQQGTPVKADNMTVAELEKAGDAARATKAYDGAIVYYEAAIRKDKKNATLYNKLGLAQLKANDTAGARLSFEKAVKKNSKFADALNNLGAVYFVQKNHNAAARYFKKAVALDETRPVFHVNLGAAWFEQNKLERAIAEYGRALQLDPTILDHSYSGGMTAQVSTAEERARYNYMLAKIYAKLGDAEQCMRCRRRRKKRDTAIWRTSTKTKNSPVCGRIRACWRSPPSLAEVNKRLNMPVAGTSGYRHGAGTA
jgi:tetratricopeptide (TPR) repeat protein